MGKWFSRKLFVFLLIFFMSSYLKLVDKISDLYYTILVLSAAIVYLYVNAVLKIKQLHISDGKNILNIEEDKNG